MSAARARSQRVLRCDCGQFVRLDRNLDAPADEARAPMPSEPPGPPDLADAFDDEVTHMVSSLEEVKALSAASRASEVRASLYDRDEDDAATRVAPESSRPSTPPPRNTPPPRRPSSPVQRAVAAPADKPLWYVDLGGAETVEMTIEQVILARRSGKLGEGALVWRVGMPDWRPVGTLIPASSSPSNAPPPVPVTRAEPAQSPLGNYERPVPTLEFALEKAKSTPAREEQTKTPAPVRVRSSAPPPPRAPTPIPRAPAVARGHSQVGPLPPPAPLPSPRTPTPLPPPPPQQVAATDEPATQATPPSTPRPVVSTMPLLGRASPTPPAETALLSRLHYPWHGERPRWVSVAIAVAVCIAASGSGAFVVRALKLRRQPLSLATTQLSATTFAATPAPPALTAPAEPEPTQAPAVVDVSSLSVEHHAPHSAPRAAALNAQALPVSAPAVPKPSENSGLEDSPAPAPKKAKTSDLPSAAHSNPYTTGSVEEAPTKKPSNGDEPGF